VTPRDPASGASVFALPARLAAKAASTLIARDEEQFERIATSLAASLDDLLRRRDELLRRPGGDGPEAMERDLEVHRLGARLRTLRRFGLDLCLGRMVFGGDDRDPVYLGRLSLTDADGHRLLIDWRAPAAEPFFAATHAAPHGLASRRRYRWTNGRVTDYWDEVFTPDGLEARAALDDQSAFIASLGASRTPRMRDVLATIQADQDAVVRAPSRGALVVDGGPGTGKTVVALHRTAYLLYSDPRLGHRRGGVLFVGPSRPYLAYVADVLPSLGEEGVLTCTLSDLVPEGAAAGPERDPRAAELKASGRLVDAVLGAVAAFERPPAAGLAIETPWVELELGPDDWAVAFEAGRGIPHNEARTAVWEELLELIGEQLREAIDDEAFDHSGASTAALRRVLLRDEGLAAAFTQAWPLLDPVALVAELWSSPGALRKAAPWLSDDDVTRLRRADTRAWTTSDLPLLDAARQRIGDPEAARRAQRREAAMAAQRERMDRVVDEMLAADDSEMKVMSILCGQDARNSLVDEAELPAADPDLLAGPFAHVVVDEAQELTDAEWRMLLRRCPSRSLTIVGDRAQARHGFRESWEDRLHRIGLEDLAVATLTVNYRTPAEVMEVAEPVIRAVLPDANVPSAVRRSGVPVQVGAVSELVPIVSAWLDAHDDGIACVIGMPGAPGPAALPDSPRVRSLSPELAKGLEFDLVVLLDADAGGADAGAAGAVDRYVAMTRATQQLVVLS